MATRGSGSIAVYPGTFDPVTLGHVDIVERATRLFGEVIVAVAAAYHKTTLFSLEERVAMTREAMAHLPEVRVEPMEGLLVDFLRTHQARAIIRGLRAVSDFEFEFQMAWMNRRLDPDVETVFLIPAENYAYLASSLIREIARLGGDVRPFVPEGVYKRLQHKFGGAP